MAKVFCPVCGHNIHRSHSRGVPEKTIRVVTGYKVYRCHECDWRGWVYKKKVRDRRKMVQTTLALLVVLAIVIVMTLYVVDRIGSAPPPPLFPEQ